MPAVPCTGALRRKLPTGHPSVAGPPGHKSFSGARSTGTPRCSRWPARRRETLPRRHRERYRDPCGHVKRDPPVSSVCCQLLTSFLEDCSSAALRLPPIGGAHVGVRTVGSEPDVGVGHAGPGYPRETERPGRTGRCGRRRRSGKVVPSSDLLSAAEGSSGARGECGVGRHRLLRQACLEAVLSRARTTSGWTSTLGRARILRSAPQGRGRVVRGLRTDGPTAHGPATAVCLAKPKASRVPVSHHFPRLFPTQPCTVT